MGERRAAAMQMSTAAAITKRIPAKLTGGRSSSPSLMKSQVEPQMQASTSHTMIGLISCRASGRSRPDVAGGFTSFNSGASVRAVTANDFSLFAGIGIQ
jgi:hypothetical protein